MNSIRSAAADDAWRDGSAAGSMPSESFVLDVQDDLGCLGALVAPEHVRCAIRSKLAPLRVRLNVMNPNAVQKLLRELDRQFSAGAWLGSQMDF
jgi:hypothetical protein